MQNVLPIACFLSAIRPPGVQFENGLLQITPVNKDKCPFVRDNNDVAFLLYTRHNPNEPHTLTIDDDESLFASSIDFNDDTVIYFHAFMETSNDGSALLVREAYIQRQDTNVIMVDAQHLEAGPWYFTAASNTWYIGRIAAEFVDYLVSRGLKLSKTHFVGHSLGSQSAGVAGYSLKSGRVSRITGLDPAFPLFDKVPLEQKLDPSDAEFVDVIHTDAGIFGFNRPVGHVDFFPNGGMSPQPGCELEVVIPQQELLNKFTGDLIGFTVNRYFVQRPLLRLSVIRGSSISMADVLAQREQIWDTGWIGRNKARRLAKTNPFVGSLRGPELNLKSFFSPSAPKRIRRSIFPMLKLLGIFKSQIREINTSIKTPQDLYNIMFREINPGQQRKFSFEVGRNNFLMNLFGRRDFLTINSE